MSEAVNETNKPKIRFRNYKPYDKSLEEKSTTDTTATSNTTAIESKSVIPEALLVPNVNPIEKELKEITSKIGDKDLNIVPRKINWDLKRHCEPKIEKLKKRTQRAIVDILREKLAENNQDEADTSDEDDE